MPLLMLDDLNEFGQYTVQMATPQQIRTIVLTRSEYEHRDLDSISKEAMDTYVDLTIGLISTTQSGKDIEIWCISNKDDQYDIPCAIWVYYKDAQWIGQEYTERLPGFNSSSKRRVLMKGRGAYPGSLLTRPGLRGKGYARILCDRVIKYLRSSECQTPDKPPLIVFHGYTHLMSIFGPMSVALNEPSLGLTIPFEHKFASTISFPSLKPITSDTHAYEVAAKHSAYMLSSALATPSRPCLITAITRHDIELYLRSFSKQRELKDRSFDDQMGVEFGEFGTDSWGYGLWRPQGYSGSWKIVTYHVSNSQSMRILLSVALEVAAKSTGVPRNISIWSGWQFQIDMLKELGFEPGTVAVGVERQIMMTITMPETSDHILQQTFWQHPHSMLYLKL